MRLQIPGQPQHTVPIYFSHEETVVDEECSVRFQAVLVHREEANLDAARLASCNEGRCSEAVRADGDLDQFHFVSGRGTATEETHGLIFASRNESRPCVKSTAVSLDVDATRPLHRSPGSPVADPLVIRQ